MKNQLLHSYRSAKTQLKKTAFLSLSVLSLSSAAYAESCPTSASHQAVACADASTYLIDEKKLMEEMQAIAAKIQQLKNDGLYEPKNLLLYQALIPVNNQKMNYLALLQGPPTIDELKEEIKNYQASFYAALQDLKDNPEDVVNLVQVQSLSDTLNQKYRVLQLLLPVPKKEVLREEIRFIDAKKAHLDNILKNDPNDQHGVAEYRHLLGQLDTKTHLLEFMETPTNIHERLKRISEQLQDIYDYGGVLKDPYTQQRYQALVIENQWLTWMEYLHTPGREDDLEKMLTQYHAQIKLALIKYEFSAREPMDLLRLNISIGIFNLALESLQLIKQSNGEYDVRD